MSFIVRRTLELIVERGLRTAPSYAQAAVNLLFCMSVSVRLTDSHRNRGIREGAGHVRARALRDLIGSLGIPKGLGFDSAFMLEREASRGWQGAVSRPAGLGDRRD